MRTVSAPSGLYLTGTGRKLCAPAAGKHFPDGTQATPMTDESSRRRPSRRSVLLGAIGALGGLAGCLSGSPSGTGSTDTSSGRTTASTDGPPTATSTATTGTTSTATTTATPRPCYASTPSVDVEGPEKPDELTADAALDLVVEFEKAYKHANLAATYDLARYSAYVVDRETHADPIDGGYRVRVKVHSDYATSGNESESPMTASGGYQHTYRVTERLFVREGTTLACWGEG